MFKVISILAAAMVLTACHHAPITGIQAAPGLARAQAAQAFKVEQGKSPFAIAELLATAEKGPGLSDAGWTKLDDGSYVTEALSAMSEMKQGKDTYRVWFSFMPKMEKGAIKSLRFSILGQHTGDSSRDFLLSAQDSKDAGVVKAMRALLAKPLRPSSVFVGSAFLPEFRDRLSRHLDAQR